MPASLRRQKEIAQALTLLAPRVPFYDAEQIREAATAPHLRAISAQNAVRLSLLAYIRHSIRTTTSYAMTGWIKTPRYIG